MGTVGDRRGRDAPGEKHGCEIVVKEGRVGESIGSRGKGRQVAHMDCRGEVEPCRMHRFKSRIGPAEATEKVISTCLEEGWMEEVGSNAPGATGVQEVPPRATHGLHLPPMHRTNHTTRGDPTHA